MATLLEPPPGKPVPAPPGYTRYLGKPTKEMVAESNKIRAKVKSPANPSGLAVGTYVVQPAGGRDCAFLIEWHKHAAHENVSDALKKWHRGVSTFVRAP